MAEISELKAKNEIQKNKSHLGQKDFQEALDDSRKNDVISQLMGFGGVPSS